MLSDSFQAKKIHYFWGMKNRHYTFLLYFISFVILATLTIQLYWNYKNYQVGKRQLTNEVQTSFNDALNDYYIQMGKQNTIGFFSTGPEIPIDIIKQIQFTDGKITNINDIDPSSIKNISVVKGPKANTHYRSKVISTQKHPKDTSFTMKNIVSSIVISMRTDTLQLDKLNQHIRKQLHAKQIELDYGFTFDNNQDSIQTFHWKVIQDANISTTATSAYLPEESTFTVYFTNATTTILKRNLIGIFLSLVLVGSVVACLFWLLLIIRQQKQLAELKNDLISNITHEFKTPISTIGVALEGIQHFNPTNDPEKIKQYLSTSTIHLEKLSLMVEKLLETASLDGGDLRLKKEKIKVDEMLQHLVTKYQALHPDKHFEFKTTEKSVEIIGDPFHLENVFNNMLDNAVKYGGNEIKAAIRTKSNLLEIDIQDNGHSLTKEQATQLFDKFYRVPKGNIHNVKGFGIGLYYTKKIIEKHGGTLVVKLTDSTNFIVHLPYE